MITPTKTLTYLTVGNLELKLDLHLPAAKAPHPCLLYLHGGALIWGSRTALIREQVDMYLDAGYALASADYRLAPETHLETIVRDPLAALAWISGPAGHAEGIDPARIAVIGSSAGGYLALFCGAAATALPYSPAAIVSWYGYGDILADWYTRPSEHYCGLPPVSAAQALAVVGESPIAAGDRSRFAYYLRTRQQGTWPECVSGLDPSQPADRARLGRLCPAHNVTAAYPPTLLIHGDADTDVPFEQSLQMSEALGKAGVRHELITVPGAGHAFDWDIARAEVQAVMRRSLRFLGEVL